MTLSVSFEEGNLVVVRSSDELKREELDQAKRQVYHHIMAHGPVYCLFLIGEKFTGLQALASWEDIQEDAVIQPNVKRLALVGDLRLRDQALIFLITAVGSFQIEYFKPDQEDFARAWLMAPTD